MNFKNYFPHLRTNFILIFYILLLACAGRDKVEVVETKIEKSRSIVEDVKLGVRKDKFTIQEKKLLSEEIRKLQNEVLALEDRVYGNRENNTFGIWGKLHLCRSRIQDNRSSEFDAGELKRPSDDDFLLNWKKDKSNHAVVEKESGNIVAINEKSLTDSIVKYNETKKTLQIKEDEINSKLIKCKALSPK